MVQALRYEAFTSTDTDLLAVPPQLKPTYEGVVNSIQLTQYFLVEPEHEWIDEAPMVLPSRGRVRVRLTGTRRMEFSSVGEEFQAED